MNDTYEVTNLEGNNLYLLYVCDWSQGSYIDVYFYFCSEGNVVRKIISTGHSTVTATSGTSKGYTLKFTATTTHLVVTILKLS